MNVIIVAPPCVDLQPLLRALKQFIRTVYVDEDEMCEGGAVLHQDVEERLGETFMMAI